MMMNVYKHIKYLSFVLVFPLLFATSCLTTRKAISRGPVSPKREFRGAWLPTIFRSEYTGLNRTDGRNILRNRIALLQQSGCNAVIFQVRAESDAWYRSDYEPWSRFFTGEQGMPPHESWDPLAFVIEECHKRGMELHAWINPYRGSSNLNVKLADNHPAKRHPEWFVTYKNQLVLNPGLPEARRYVVQVAEDIVTRYDIDALHIDDYFYPYPAKGLKFADEEAFSRYGLSAGYQPQELGHWRRNNVNMLIYELRQMITKTKPWVRFGVSPFGIYRNATTDRERGSETKGLQSYDNLYADILHWANEGWIDYVAPQVYWDIGYQIADYEVLTKWWSKHVTNPNVHLYIGQDVKRTMNSEQLEQKLLLSRAYSKGNVFWPGDELVRNYKGVSEDLRLHHQQHKALLPQYRSPLGKAHAPNKLQVVWEDVNEDGHMLIWNDEHVASDPETPFFYIVYAFPPSKRPSVRRHEYITSISREPYYKLPQLNGATEYTFLITSVNRFWQESKPYKIKVTL